MANLSLVKHFIFVVICSGVVSQDPVNTCLPNLDYNSNAPDASDCQSYVVCDNGSISQTRRCITGGMGFDIYELVCRATHTCFAGLDPSCDIITGHPRVPSKDLCRQYYDCENGGQLQTCPDDLPYFNYRTEECREDGNVFCYPASSKEGAPTGSPTPTTTVQTTSTVEPTTSETTIHTPSTEPTTSGPTLVTTTETGGTDPTPTATTSEPTTDPGATTASPPLINTCQPNFDYPDPLPHPITCTMRVQCENGSIVAETLCPAGWNFDYIFLSCVPAADAICFPGESISCATHSTAERPFMPHPKYCRQYYDCNSLPVNGNRIGVACQEPTPFFDYRGMHCGTADSVLCYPGTTRDIPPPSKPATAIDIADA